jgi:hypothetical protein
MDIYGCKRCEKFIKVCGFCGVDYFPSSNGKVLTSKYCSRDCLHKFLGKKHEEEWKVRHDKWNNEPRESYVEIMKIAFENFVNKTEGCWNWMGSTKGKSRMKYGNFTFRGKELLAHRSSYVIYKGDIPEGMLVLHSCDVPQCVNPDHLWLGSYLDNQRDKMAKGRGKVEKLNPDKVKELKSLMKSDFGDTNLARKYGVSYQTIWAIRTGKTWKDIE